MNKAAIALFVFLSPALLLSGPKIKNACAENGPVMKNRTGIKNRLEANFSYEYFAPNGPYGSWKTFNLAWYRRPSMDLTYFLRVGAFSRKDEQGGLGTAGAYKDWATWMYTYTDLSLGTNSDYLPQARADNDFNFKLGEKKNIVWTAGLSYIKYSGVHKDFILSTGLTLYRGRWIGTYRLFRNTSAPGSVTSPLIWRRPHPP